MTTFHELCETLLRPPPVGGKDGDYFLRGPLREGFTTRADDHLARADMLVLDGDSSFDPETGEVTQGAPPPLQVHIALIEADIPHVLYTTHSDRQPGKGHRYRVLIPTMASNKAELKTGIGVILAKLHEAGCYLADVPENHRMSQPWFFPRVPDTGCEYLCYTHEGDPNAEIQAELGGSEVDASLEVEALEAADMVAKPRNAASPFDQFNEVHGLDWMLEVLERNGYAIVSKPVINGEPAFRLLSPHSNSGIAGIILFQGRDHVMRVYSHHNTADPLTKSGGSVSTSDAWDLFRIFQHNGDQKAALAAWREELNPRTALPIAAPSVPIIQNIEKVEPLDPVQFPNQRVGKSGQIELPATVANIRHMINGYDVQAGYDVIGKRINLRMPGLSGCPDNADNSALTHCISLATLNGIAVGQVPHYIAAIADTNQYNPVIDYILRRPWDGIDRLEDLYACLVVRDDDPEGLNKVMFRRWLISAVAAVFMASGFRSRGVFVLQGAQSIGKTAFFLSLVDDPALRDRVIKIDHHLDASCRDSKMTAISHWFVEIGELDSSFKKDVARLKGFITNNVDKFRRPYDRVDSEFARRTVFCASVNSENFLVDDTGNTRWWTIPVTAVDYNHGIDMQQLWAQVHQIYEAGEQWWLTAAEEKALEERNQGYRTVNAVRDALEAKLDLTRPESNWSLMPAIEVLSAIGIHNPTNAQARDCGSYLREMFGEPTKSKGKTRWRVPLKASDYLI